MSSFHNMGGRFTSAYAPAMTHSDDLLGFPCNTTEFFNDFTQKKTHEITTHNYPSPPPTQFKRSVPLPSFQTDPLGGFSMDEDSRDVDDSSMVDLCPFPNVQSLISPPPTLPTSSHALPPTDGMDAVFFPHSHSAQDLKLYTCFPRPLEDPDASSDLLSPLSPDWGSGDISDMNSISPDESVLLGGEHSTGFGGDYTMGEAMVQRRKDSSDGSCLKKSGLWTPRKSPEQLKSFSLSPSSLLSVPPSYSELPADSAPPYSNSPFMQSHYLSPIDDVLLHSPATPRHSFKTLPDPEPFLHYRMIDSDESDMDMDTFMVPPSSSSPTLALPGADMDDDLVLGLSSNFESAGPSILSDPPSPGCSSSGSSSLLLDDPEIPTPRSPSPDNFDFDSLLNQSECSDPDIQNLIELRRRSLEAERTAKSLERTMLDEGWIYKSNEARWTRKRAKERCKELSAMLKLRLGEKGAVMPSLAEDEGVKSVKKQDGMIPAPAKKEKEVSIIRDMEQLVARMMLRRKELDTMRTLGRSIPKSLEPGARTMQQKMSPLRQSWVNGPDDYDENEDEGEYGRRTRSKEVEMEDEDDDIEMETGLNLSAFELSDSPSTSNMDYSDPPWTMVSPGHMGV